MAITAGQNALASDFITESEKDATPSNDAGRVPQLESDGKLDGYFTKNGFKPNAGATINGATLPVPVYQNKSDNEVYACDGNDTAAMKFIGFAITNSTNGNPIKVQTNGVVSGFSGLAEGEKYYVQDAVGTIGTTPGTQEILVGIAISETALLIQKGRRFASGVLSGESDTTITLGFRPSIVRIFATASESDTVMTSAGSYANGANKCVYHAYRGANEATEGNSTSACLHLERSGQSATTAVIDTVTDTGFNINYSGGASTTTPELHWEAEGEL